MAKHILIVDDDEDDRDLFCSALQEVDPSVKCSQAGHGEEALRALRKPGHSMPNYIFLDLNMPRMNGKQCLAELKKDASLSSIPVIIYTTSKLEEDREECRQLGSVYFISKPSTLQELCSEILFVLSHKWEEVIH